MANLVQNIEYHCYFWFYLFTQTIIVLYLSNRREPRVIRTEIKSWKNGNGYSKVEVSFYTNVLWSSNIHFTNINKCVENSMHKTLFALELYIFRFLKKKCGRFIFFLLYVQFNSFRDRKTMIA